MTTTYQQTDTSQTFDVGCSGQTAGVTTAARRAETGAAAGSVEVTVDPDNDLTRACFVYDCFDPPELSSWDAGTWEVNINHTTMDGGTQLTRIDVCDFDGSTYSTVATNTSPGHTRGATGLLNATVTQGSAHTPQTVMSSRPFVVLTYNNNDPHGASSLGITPDDTIVAPFDIPVDSLLLQPRRARGVRIPIVRGTFPR